MTEADMKSLFSAVLISTAHILFPVIQGRHGEIGGTCFAVVWLNRLLCLKKKSKEGKFKMTQLVNCKGSMHFAFIVNNWEKFFFEWLNRCLVQTWTAFQQIYIRLMKSDSSRSSPSHEALFSCNLCICMSDKHCYDHTVRWGHSQRGTMPQNSHHFTSSNWTSCSDWTTKEVGFFYAIYFLLSCRLLLSDTQHAIKCKKTHLWVICFLILQSPLSYMDIYWHCLLVVIPTGCGELMKPIQAVKQRRHITTCCDTYFCRNHTLIGR